MTLLKKYHAGSGGKFRICFHPGENAADEFDAVCRLVRLARNTVFVVDEVWRFCKSGYMTLPLESITFTGRQPGVTMLYTAQQPARISTGLRSITTKLYVFRVSRRDFDAIAYDFGIPDEMADRVLSLPDHHCVVRDEKMQWGEG